MNALAPSRAVRWVIGVVLDEGCFPETLTAPQVGRVMAATYCRWEQDTFDAYCRRFGLPEKTAFKDYSRGMKMKLTIAADELDIDSVALGQSASVTLDAYPGESFSATVSHISRIGTVSEGKAQVALQTRIGGRRLLGMLEGAQLPRIC